MSEPSQTEANPSEEERLGSETAFPLPDGHTQIRRWAPGYGEYRVAEATAKGGLTKRELFAMAAKQGLAPQYCQGGDFMEGHVAKGAVLLADALLKELAK